MTTRTQVADGQTNNIADQAAETATQAIRSTQSLANAAFDRMNDKVEGARDTASPMIDRWSSQAEAAARRSVEAMRETSAQLREKALQAAGSTSGRIQDDPLKAVLIAAAAGAALMALLNLLRRD